MKPTVENELRVLRAYAVFMSLCATLFLLGAINATKSAAFDSLDVHVLNVRDADGTLRLALFGKQWEPPQLVAGHAYRINRSGNDRAAGMMFYNDRHDEIGGMILGNSAPGQRPLAQTQSLTFDAYEQDQVVQLEQDQEGSEREAGLIVHDRPLNPTYATMLPEYFRTQPARRPKMLAALTARGAFGEPRLFAGITHGNATLTLRDAKGHVRLRFAVAPNGTPRIEFLDANGRVVKTISS